MYEQSKSGPPTNGPPSQDTTLTRHPSLPLQGTAPGYEFAPLGSAVNEANQVAQSLEERQAESARIEAALEAQWAACGGRSGPLTVDSLAAIGADEDDQPDDYQQWVAEVLSLDPVAGYAPDLREFCGQRAPSEYLILLGHRKLFTDDNGDQVLTCELYNLGARPEYALELVEILTSLPITYEVIRPGVRGPDSTLIVIRRDLDAEQLPPEFEVPEPPTWGERRIARLGRWVEQVRAAGYAREQVEQPMTLSWLRNWERKVLAGKGDNELYEPLEEHFDKPGKYMDSAHLEAHNWAAETGCWERLDDFAVWLLSHAAAGAITFNDAVHEVRTLARLTNLADEEVPGVLERAWSKTYTRIERAAA